ncbi:MAG: hypothetical protein ACFFBD_21035 [Candidatus Hodarchaeota archaeon]
MSGGQSEPALKWLGLASSLPIMTFVGAALGYYLTLSVGYTGIFNAIGVTIGAFAGFFLSLFELLNYARKDSKKQSK